MINVVFIFGIIFITTLVALIYFIPRTRKYDGEMVVTNTIDGGRLFSLELYGDPNDLEFKKRVVFKVTKEVA